MSEARPCGVYRTGRALRAGEMEIPAGSLVYFHNHSVQGPPIVLLPDANTNNRWSYTSGGWLVEDPAFIEAMVSLKGEGFYALNRRLQVGKDEFVAERSLVQLGYNRSADTILFVAKPEGNGFNFPDRGLRFDAPDVQEILEPVNFTIPAAAGAEQRTLH